MQLTEDLFIAQYLSNPLNGTTMASAEVKFEKTRQAISARIKRVQPRFEEFKLMLGGHGLKITDVSDENLDRFVRSCRYKHMYADVAIEVTNRTIIEFYSRGKEFNDKFYPDGNRRPLKGHK